VKASPKDRISLCEEDTRKVLPTTLMIQRTNFTPTKDLNILFIPSLPEGIRTCLQNSNFLTRNRQ
jgi:hypothetical protein